MRQEGKAEARFPAPDLPEPELLYSGISIGKECNYSLCEPD